jgi:hypothetical protein
MNVMLTLMQKIFGSNRIIQILVEPNYYVISFSVNKILPLIFFMGHK